MQARALRFARGERVIAVGRLVLAVFSLVALQLDRELDAGARVVAAVVVYAVALAAAAWLYPFATTQHRLAVHLADFLLYALLIEVTHASVSPFFVFFLFAVFSALLRFGVRGTLLTAAAAILVYVTLALLDDRIRSAPSYLVLGVAALCVATLLLVYLGDRADFTSDDVTLAEIVGRLVATRLDQLHATERMRTAAVGEERIRVARDLHDGLLQSLTGVALQLESVHKLVGVDDAAVQQRLRRVQELIEHDQRELRSLIAELRVVGTDERTASLGVRLLQLAERFERQWEVAVSVFIDPPLPSLSDELAGEIYSLVSEAVANAAKHAHASRIDVTVRSAAGGRVEIAVQDDGRGFPFEGEFDLRALNELRRGPVTLKERVASLGGELVLQSAPEGTTLQIRI